MGSSRKHWLILAAVLFVTFMILGFFGREVYRQAPPIPAQVKSADGTVLMTQEEILDGQQAWQSMGGQQVGTVWGHGAYQAPDWSADWLHREAVELQEIFSQEAYGRPYHSLSAEQKGGIDARLKAELRTNTFDEATKTITVSPQRAAAMQKVAAHYVALFGDDPSLKSLRESYAIHENPVPDEVRRQGIADFFFWTAWSCTTQRPNDTVTYTNNWPHEPLAGNQPTSANLLWSILSIILLIAAVGGMVWYKAFKDRHEEPPTPPVQDPLGKLTLTPSMKAMWKYVAVVVALFFLQVVMGIIVAHYTVEGQDFYGLPLAEILPYSLARTWHIQLGVFWIATAFLTVGLFLAPAVGGGEPRFQRLGVNVLFGALLVVVLGSMAGEWFSIRQVMGLDIGFWFGHQGYEYVDLGRAWQIALFAGLLIWLFLMIRGIGPALKVKDEQRPMVLIFGGSAAAIGLFYASGFFYGARTHLSVMEYWRWWVVHLWVEGFMEVFATAAMAFLFSRLGLIRTTTATRATLATATLYLVGGIPGTFHHLYFSGTPVSIMAVGATFSALEVVPLALVGFEAFETWRLSARAPWMHTYRWPIRFFLGVAFWNLVGAGIFGFLINPPIALYYMQGLNTTPVHAHAAMFGVYGLLSLGLILFVMRRLKPEGVWKDGVIKFAFWAMNIGLILMIALSLLPVGLAQTVASVDQGLWWARSAEFLQQPHMEVLRWLRIVGDSLFFAGVAALVWFAIGLKTGWSLEKPESIRQALTPER